jgi:hypothetical protein
MQLQGPYRACSHVHSARAVSPTPRIPCHESMIMPREKIMEVTSTAAAAQVKVEHFKRKQTIYMRRHEPSWQLCTDNMARVAARIQSFGHAGRSN